jgi:hypothetical protein
MTLDADRYRLSEDEHQAIFDRRIKPEIFATAKTVDRPVAVIFGGQPGSGKSAAVDAAVQSLAGRGGAVQVIGDDLRPYHPAYASLMQRDDKTAAFYTDRDSGRWVEKSIAYAKEHRLNLVIEGTMRSPAVVADTMKGLRQAGYEIDARALAVNELLSWQGVMQRYEAQKQDRGAGRMTAPHSHRDAYNGMPDTLERIERERLADRVTVYRRGGQAIYSNELRNGQWKQEPQARQVLEAERARPLTLPERQAYAEGFERLAEQMAKPGRNASADEIRQVQELRTQASREFAGEVFRQRTPEHAMQTHPELAGAYAVLGAVGKKVDADGLTPQQKEVVMARSREQIATAIERGQEPRLSIRVEQRYERSNDSGPER